jgi:hypothetical protein
MLSLSSIPSEYYFGDLPGTIQYNKSPQDILQLVLPDDPETRGYVLAEHSLEHKLSVTTNHIQKAGEWKLLLVMKSEMEGHTWIKAALQHKDGHIALMTATNGMEHLKRPITTLREGWYVGHYRMCAPVCFWRELQNRLRY